MSFSRLLFFVHDGVHGLQETGARRAAGRSGRHNGDLSVGSVAWAALVAVVLIASRLLALQFTLGTLAVGGLDALVGAIQLLADRRALGFRSSAGSVALGWSANGLALGAIFLLAIVLGATDTAGRTFAMNNTFGASSLFTFHLTLRTSADRVANSWASRIIALPAASGVALLSRSTNDGNKAQGGNNKGSHDCSSKEDLVEVWEAEFLELGKPNRRRGKKIARSIVDEYKQELAIGKSIRTIFYLSFFLFLFFSFSFLFFSNTTTHNNQEKKKKNSTTIKLVKRDPGVSFSFFHDHSFSSLLLLIL